MKNFLDLSNSLLLASKEVLNSIFVGIYSILIILVFLFIGYIVSEIIRYIFVWLFEKLKVREYFEKNEFTRVLNKWHFDKILIFLLEITIILVFLQQATVYVNATVFSYYLQLIIQYIPYLIVGLIILIGSLILAEYIHIILSKSNNLISQGASIILQIIIVYIGIIYSLKYILPNFNENVLVMILQYILITFTLAFGLGFAIALGLGLKDSINQAARKNQGIFDNIFSKLGGSINEAIKTTRKRTKSKEEKEKSSE